MTWGDVYATLGITPADVRLWRVVALYEQLPAPSPAPIPKRGLLPCEVGRVPGSAARRIPRPQDQTVVVGNEVRGPDWGIGRAAAEFARLRQEYARIPNGQHYRQDMIDLGLLKG